MSWANDRELSYWTALFSWTTWTEFREAGATTAGYREKKWTSVRKIREGDSLLSYLTGLSRWVGILEVTGPPFQSTESIWSSEDFPCRVPVKLLVALEPEMAIPVVEMRDQLSIFQNLKNPKAWGWHFYSAPRKFSYEDGMAVRAAIEGAAKSPLPRPFDRRKLGHMPGV